MTPFSYDQITADLERVSVCTFEVPTTDDGRPILLIGPHGDRPVLVACPLRNDVASSAAFRPDYRSMFHAGERVTVETSELGGIAYVYVKDAPELGRSRREIWWRQSS